MLPPVGAVGVGTLLAGARLLLRLLLTQQGKASHACRLTSYDTSVQPVQLALGLCGFGSLVSCHMCVPDKSTHTASCWGTQLFSCGYSSVPGNTTSLTLLFLCRAREIPRTGGGCYCCCLLHHWPLHCARENSRWEFKMLSLFPRGWDAEKSILPLPCTAA